MATTGPARAPTRADRVRLILLSFLMLFLELALIRWTGANVVYLSFFTNFVLLGSFLGIGLGFLRANKARNLFPYAPLAVAVLVAFILISPVELKSSSGNLIYFGEIRTSGLPREIVLTIIFLVVAAALMCVAEGVARTFKEFEPLEAYWLDLVGAILGILGIAALALLRAPSLVWGAVVAVLFVAVEITRDTSRLLRLLQIGSVAAVLIMLGFESFAAGVSWSPYYKVKTEASEALGGQSIIQVNGILHQANTRADDNPTYTLVYDRVPDNPLDDVLIIGAGGGNDVSVALARGAKHIDAVEIDPRLQELGEETHPDHPYDDPRVDVHIDDGRAYLEGTEQKYDLILFALPDSITLLPGQSSVRLESYLFTKEALEAARERLKPNGAFSMYNYYREPWLLDRFAGTLDEVFGHRPCAETVLETGLYAVLVDAPAKSAFSCDTRWRPTGEVPKASTDDHPFPYLRTRSIPNLYLLTIAFILIASLLLVRVVAGRLRAMTGYLDLFFMGIAFLLLETQNVVKFALLFGTTWVVNALVFLGLLLSVLAAVAVSRRVTFKRPARLYLVLIASLVVAFALPQSSLLSLSPVPRFFVGSVIAFAPVFIANLVFSQRFKSVGSSTNAFAVNLIGAMVGGLLEYVALIIGYRSLLIVVAVAYGLAFVAGRSHLSARAPAPTG
ncbi:MAG: spermidine synthase [Actinobacteria bacterium]|nr:spermidine synthase [Actinomycetota bacterium]